MQDGACKVSHAEWAFGEGTQGVSGAGMRKDHAQRVRADECGREER